MIQARTYRQHLNYHFKQMSRRGNPLGPQYFGRDDGSTALQEPITRSTAADGIPSHNGDDAVVRGVLDSVPRTTTT